MSDNFKTITGSSTFQVMIFSPFTQNFRASTRICLCNTCIVEYGTCDNFKLYEIISQSSNVSTRSNNLTSPATEVECGEGVIDGAVCAVANYEDNLELIRVTGVHTATEKMVDTENNVFLEGSTFVVGQRLNACGSNKKGKKYKLSDNNIYFIKDTIMIPYVQIDNTNSSNYILNNEEYYRIIGFLGYLD